MNESMRNDYGGMSTSSTLTDSLADALSSVLMDSMAEKNEIIQKLAESENENELLRKKLIHTTDVLTKVMVAKNKMQSELENAKKELTDKTSDLNNTIARLQEKIDELVAQNTTATKIHAENIVDFKVRIETALEDVHRVCA